MYKKVYVEITNICNLNCSFCLKNQRTPQLMKIDDFKKILEKLKGHTKYLYFHVLGEPLMHPQINEFIDLASKDFFINLTSNGYLIEKIKEQKNIRQINISLHSYSENKNISLKEYLTNIITCVNELKKHSFISYRIWTKTKYKEEIIAFLEEYYQKKIDKKMKLEENVFIEFEHTFTWPELEHPFLSDIGTCYALKDHIAILVDGTVVPCCLDGKGIINLGNIFKSSLDEIEQKERYQNMLKGFKCKKKEEDLCKRCNFIK